MVRPSPRRLCAGRHSTSGTVAETVLPIDIAAAIALVALDLWFTNQLSYRILKNRLLAERMWD